MSEKLCTLRTQGGGGAKYTETSLWTNQSPTSSSGFAAQTVSLSGNISDYKYIAIDYCYGKDYTNITSREIYTVDDFIKAVKNSGVRHTIGGLTIEDEANASYSRPVFYISDTSVAFGVCSKLDGSGAYATASIPIEILGLNELDHGTKYITNFVAIYSGSGISGTNNIASRGYITANASDGDTISAGATEYFTEQNVSGTSGYIKVYAAKDLDAMVIEGYATVAYKNRHFSQGDLIGTINRNVSNTLWIGVYE